MLTIEFFSMSFIRKGKKFVSKQSQPHVHSEARVPTKAGNCKMV